MTTSSGRTSTDPGSPDPGAWVTSGVGAVDVSGGACPAWCMRQIEAPATTKPTIQSANASLHAAGRGNQYSSSEYVAEFMVHPPSTSVETSNDAGTSKPQATEGRAAQSSAIRGRRARNSSVSSLAHAVGTERPAGCGRHQ